LGPGRVAARGNETEHRRADRPDLWNTGDDQLEQPRPMAGIGQHHFDEFQPGLDRFQPNDTAAILLPDRAGSDFRSLKSYRGAPVFMPWQ